MSVAEEVGPFHEIALSVLDYVPCKWTGCEAERYYLMGRCAGYCEEHGSVVMTKAREEARVVEDVRRAERAVVAPCATALARDVVAAAKKLDRASLSIRGDTAGRRRRALDETRDALRALIVEVARQAAS
jgi:hypothetical protein